MLQCERRQMEKKKMDNKELEENIARKQDLVRKALVKQYIEYRKNRNLTQEELACTMGIKRPNISRFETGEYNPTLDLLVKMAECMNLEIEIILTEKGSGNEEQ